MRKIKKLPPQEIHKIAAGEVIERPVNVVKELIENAIDAHANRIEIYVENAGQTLIRVIDNGCGMNADDAQYCFEHHATSKINSFEELLGCKTLGFRGEALTSIAAIAKVTLITKEAAQEHGIQLTKRDGIDTIQPIACNTGTDIRIEDLFYNVPARKKFLKNEQTEWRQIYILFQAFCFSYPSIQFTIHHNNKLLHNCLPVHTIKERVLQIWEHNWANQLISVSQKTDLAAIEGVISNHQSYKYDRSYLFFFINNRWIKNSAIAKAIIKGYLNVLPQGRFPSAVLTLTIDNDEIDINIHPRKEEVRFRHPKLIEQQLTQLVKSNLEQKINIGQKRLIFTTQPVPTINQHPVWPFDFPTSAAFPKPSPVFESTKLFSGHVQIDTSIQKSAFIVTTEDAQQYRYLGTFAMTYLIFERPDELLLVDQHAAHERIMYETIKTQFGNPITIDLLFPERLLLTREELNWIIPHLQDFAQYGLLIEQFDEQQLIIRSKPVYLKNCIFVDLIREIIALIVEHQHIEKNQFSQKLHEHIHAQMACKAAVKAGDSLQLEQINQLIKDLFTVENRFVCPHGRPTFWSLPQHEIEKKFKRKL